MTVDHIELMKHCIGYTQRSVKRGKYEAYRNFYNSGEERDPAWDELVAEGLAKQFIRFEQYFYCLTEKGIELLERILEVKIVVIK